MNREDFQKLAETRLEDAKALLKAGRFDAAYYLAGYVVECALKACIAKQTKEYDFPPRNAQNLYTHDLETLLKASEFGRSFDTESNRDAKLKEYWDIVKDWEETRRYELLDEAKIGAEALLQAIADENHGVLRCISKYW
jgi:HEPN domain-containing protein